MELQLAGDLQRSHKRQNKMLFWGFLGLFLFSIVWGVYIFNARVNAYSSTLFALSGEGEPDQETTDRLAEIAALQGQDSDADGLSDFQERFETNTSEFLVDTDGDAISDFDEFTAGTDPNCAEGNDCGVRALTTPTDDIATADTAAIETFLALEDLSPEQLREEMVKIGIPQETVDQATDEELQSVYQTVKQQYTNAQNATADTGASTSDEVDPDENITAPEEEADPFAGLLLEDPTADSVLSQIDSADDLATLDASQVRQLLKQGGMSEDDLSALSDEELLASYQQALREQSAN